MLKRGELKIAAEEGCFDIAEFVHHSNITKDSIYPWVDAKEIPFYQEGALI